MDNPEVLGSFMLSFILCLLALIFEAEMIDYYWCFSGEIPRVWSLSSAPPPTFAHVMAGRRVKLPFFLGLISGLLCCNFLLTWIWTGRDTLPKAPFSQGEERTAVPYSSKGNRQKGLAMHVLIGADEEWRMVPAIHDTWGRSTTYLAFHGPTVSLADDETLAHMGRLSANAHLFYRNASQGSNDAYVLLLQDICALKQQFEWVAIVKPTTYVLVDRMKDFLKYLDSAKPVWLGQPDAAGSSVGCAVCDDMGSVFSKAAVNKMCLNLWSCSQGLDAAPPNSSHLQSGFVADCMGVCCMNDISVGHTYYLSQFFYSPGNLLLRQALQMGALDGNPHVDTALIISGLERPEHVLNVHFYFVMMSKSTAAKVATIVREELLDTAHKLKEVLKREASARPQAHPLWLADHHLQPPSKESSMGEVIPWESFNLARKQAVTSSAHSPVRNMNEYELKTMIDGIVKLVPASSSTLSAPLESVFVHRRVDPFRGIDHLVESCSREGETCRMHHILQGFELPVITSVEETLTALVEVKFVVSSPLMSRAFHRFITSFESSFLVSHSEENVGLLAVVSSDGQETDIEDGTFAVSTILHLYKKKYPHVDFRMVLTEGMPTQYEVARIATKEFSFSELLFILDVHLDVAALLPQHCRVMAKMKERAYIPISFAPYNPGAFHWARLELPIVMQFQVSPRDGLWLSGVMDAVCVYNSDLISVLDAATEQTADRWSLSEAIKAHVGLTVFHSVDPGLAYMWHEQCAEGDKRTKRQVCEELDKINTAHMKNGLDAIDL